MNRTAIINILFNKYNFQSYLEIGLEYPENNFNRINAKIKESVDPFPKGDCTHVMTSDAFFKKYPDKKYDVIFIDGMQTKEQAYKDAINAMTHLNDGGFIIIHSCDPRHEHLTVSYKEFLRVGGCWLGTMYKAFIQLKNELSDWSCFVVGGGWGCGILTPRKILPNAQVNFKRDISWNQYIRNRKILLQWISFDEYVKIITGESPSVVINDRYMDLVDNDCKVSYSLFKQNKILHPWASHQPVLIHTLNTIKEGAVLEYGMGDNSSQIMHIICGMQGRELLSVETDKKWMDKFKKYKTDLHELICMSYDELGKWDHKLFKKKYAIAFIDGSSNISRQKFIEVIKDNVDYFIVHDTEEVANNFTYPGFSYKWDFSGFKHQHHLQKGGPVTSLLSNLDDINKDLLTIF
jgi:hypothetical protein